MNEMKNTIIIDFNNTNKHIYQALDDLKMAELATLIYLASDVLKDKLNYDGAIKPE